MKCPSTVTHGSTTWRCDLDLGHPDVTIVNRHNTEDRVVENHYYVVDRSNDASQ